MTIFTSVLTFLQAGEEEQVCPVIMCTRAFPDHVPECQLFPGEVGEPEEEEVAVEGKERESDRDSAVESTQGSDTSEGLTRLGKEDTLGDLFLPGEKYVLLDPFRVNVFFRLE